MKFKVSRASDWGKEWELEFSTIEELVAWVKANGDQIILSTWGPDRLLKDAPPSLPEITIYDDCVE